jgi:hypothetical protein
MYKVPDPLKMPIAYINQISDDIKENDQSDATIIITGVCSFHNSIHFTLLKQEE